jgi:SAM-dependent methyltransferase
MIGDITDKAYGVENIDWAGLWHQQMDEASFRGQGADFWDNWGRTLPEKKEHSGYVEEVMSRLRLEPEYSVLDVGSGTGALAIPLAKQVRSVTALDRSPVLLSIVSRNAAAAGLNNILTLNLDWTKAQLGTDFQQHDVVVVSRSLPAGKDVSRCLKLIDAAARRSCYITWKASAYDELEAEISRLLGVTYRPFPEHIVLYNLLHSIGIHAEVNIFRTGGCRRYETLEEAFLQIVRSQPVEPHQKQAILDMLASRMENRDRAFYQPKNALWALIHWDKNV